MPAIPLPDAQSGALLHGARLAARGDLDGRPQGLSGIPSAAPPSSAHPLPGSQAPMTPPPSSSAQGPGADFAAPPPSAGISGPPADIESAGFDSAGPGADLAALVGDDSGPPADAPAPTDSKASAPSLFAGLGFAVGNGLMRGFVGMGRVIGLAGAPLVDAATLGNTDAMGAYFRGLDSLVDGAMQNWQPAQPVGSGSRVLGSVAEGAAPLLTGDLGMVVNAGINSAADSVTGGQDLKTAAKVALISAAATGAGLRLPLKSPVLWRRLAIGALGMPAIGAGARALTHKILSDAGYKQAASQVNWADPQQNSVDALMGAIFGAIARPDVRGSFHNAAAGERPAAGATPPAEGPPADIELPEEEPEAGEPAPPALTMARVNGADVPVQVVGDAGNGQTRVRLLDETGEAGEEHVIPAGAIRLPGQPAGVVAGPAVARVAPSTGRGQPMPAIQDTPSAEPVTDLQAQIADMRDPTTLRRAVYLSPDNVATLGPDGVAKLAEGSKRIPNFDRKGGVLVVPDAATARMARDLRATEPDMQKVLGQLTGAGEGKAPDQTLVVQGQTPQGAVASETMVRPDQVAAAVGRARAEGKAPVVTTPQAAIARRAALVTLENGTPDAGQLPTSSEPLEPLGRGPWNPAAEMEPPTRSEQLKARAAARRAPISSDLHERLADPAVSTEIERMAGNAGWAEVGGRLLMDDNGKVLGRTKWLPREEWYPDLSTRLGKNDRSYPEVVRDALAGKPLNAKEQRVIEQMTDIAEARVGGDVPNLDQLSAEQADRAEYHREQAGSAPADVAAYDLELEQLRHEQDDELDAIAAREREPEDEGAYRVAADGAGENALEPAQEGRRRADTTPSGREGEGFALEGGREPSGTPRPRALRSGDLFGEDTSAAQALADETRRRDLARSSGQESIETGDPGDLFSQARHQTDFDEMQAAPGAVYADKLLGDAARNLDAAGFSDQLRRLQEAGAPVSLHNLLDYAGRGSGSSPLVRAIIHAVRTHVPETPVHLVRGAIETRDGLILKPATAGVHEMEPGLHRIQVRIDHPYAHPLRTLLHESAHAATSAHLKMHPESEFSQQIERLRQIAHDRAERALGRKLQAGDYKGDLYGLKNAKEFMAETLSNGAFQRRLIESEQYATPGEKLRSILSRVGDAVRKLFGIRDGVSKNLLDNVLFATRDVMRAQHAEADRFARILRGDDSEPRDLARLDMLSTGEQLGALSDALEAEGPAPRFRGEDESMRRLPESIREPARDLRYLASGKLDAMRKGVRAWASYDQLVRRGLWHFGSPDDPTNPLRVYDATRVRRITVQNRAIEKSAKVAERWARLPAEQSHQLGGFMRDTTIWGIDPRKPLTDQTAKVQGSLRAVRKYDEFAARWQALTTEQRQIYTEAETDNRRMAKLQRKTVIDTVLRSVESNISPAQLSLFYAVRDPRQFDALIGEGRPVDLGEFNTMVRETLKDLSPLTELEGPYFHLGREGSKVVQVTPEGERTFATKAEAQAFAGRVRELGPTSTAKIHQDEKGQWVVAHRAKYVSMHHSRAEAEADAARMRAQGFDVGPVTEKLLSRESAPITQGMRELLAEAERKIGRFGANDAQDAATNEALMKTLRSAFAEMLAARHAEAGSRLARRGVAGVKPEEMRMAYARHAISSASHIGAMATLFDEANALGRLREAARNPEIGNATQDTMYARGLLLHELSKRIRQDAESRATTDPLTRALSHLSFLNYIVSPAHALVWATQNITTGIPVAGARFGYFKALRAFGKGMGSPALPALRETLRGLVKPGSVSADDINRGVLAALRRDPKLAKWTAGENSPMQQLADRGALTSTLTNEMAGLARINGGSTLGKVENWARLLPHLADLYNRVSTAIAGLELTGGDVAKTADLIQEIHVNYASENKPRAFKELSRGPGKTLVLLKTYVQGMAHLLLTNVYDSMTGAGKSRAEAAKTIAGLIAGAGLFAGATGTVPEPVRWLVDAWHHLFGSNDKYFDLDNAMRRWLSDKLGETGGEVAAEGLPRALGVDLSQRMGFAHLLFYDAPDLLGPQSPSDKLTQMLQAVAGPLYTMPAEHWQTFQTLSRRGEPVQAWLSLLPVKALDDAQKAYRLATGGYQTSITNVPAKRISGWQDFMQGIGFRPEMIANASERAQTVYQYRQWAHARQREILGQWKARPSDPTVTAQIEQWNKTNPGMLITRSDLIRAARGQWNASRLGAGLPGRNPTVNRLLSY